MPRDGTKQPDTAGLLSANRASWAHVLRVVAVGLAQDPRTRLAKEMLAAIDGRGDALRIMRRSAVALA